MRSSCKKYWFCIARGIPVALYVTVIKDEPPWAQYNSLTRDAHTELHIFNSKTSECCYVITITKKYSSYPIKVRLSNTLSSVKLQVFGIYLHFSASTQPLFFSPEKMSPKFSPSGFLALGIVSRSSPRLLHVFFALNVQLLIVIGLLKIVFLI